MIKIFLEVLKLQHGSVVDVIRLITNNGMKDD